MSYNGSSAPSQQGILTNGVSSPSPSAAGTVPGQVFNSFAQGTTGFLQTEMYNRDRSISFYSAKKDQYPEGTNGWKYYDRVVGQESHYKRLAAEDLQQHREQTQRTSGQVSRMRR